jgi:hypothetical protein
MSGKIKKAYEAIVEVLQANLSATVEEVLPQVLELASAKTGSGGGKATTFHRNEAGEVVAIFCYAHKLWMDPRVAEFGAKAGSATGFNNMCKDGVNKWTSAQRKKKAAEGELLARVADGEVAPADIAAEQARIADEAGTIEPREDNYGFETLEECLADSEERGL